MNNLLSDKQKAWAAFIIGTLTQAIAIVAAIITDGSTREILFVISGIAGSVGAGLGVYGIKNQPVGTKVD